MRVGVLPEKTDECSKVFLSTIESTEAQNRDRDNLNFGQTNTLVNGTTNGYTIGRGPLFQITDSRVSRFDIAKESITSIVPGKYLTSWHDIINFNPKYIF